MNTVVMPRLMDMAGPQAANFPNGAMWAPVSVVRQVKIDLQTRRKPLGPDESYEANVPNYGKVELRGWGPRMWYRFTPADAYRKRQNLPAVIEGHGMPGLFG